MGATILLVLQGLQLVGTLFPSTIAAALSLQKIFAADGSEFTTQIQTLQDGAIQSAEDTLTLIAEWKKANGYTD